MINLTVALKWCSYTVRETFFRYGKARASEAMQELNYRATKRRTVKQSLGERPEKPWYPSFEANVVWRWAQTVQYPVFSNRAIRQDLANLGFERSRGWLM